MNIKEIRQALSNWNNGNRTKAIPVWMAYLVPKLVEFLLAHIAQLEEENKRLREVVLFWEYPMVGGNLIKEDIPYKDVRKLFDQLGDALKKDNIPSET